MAWLKRWLDRIRKSIRSRKAAAQARAKRPGRETRSTAIEVWPAYLLIAGLEVAAGWFGAHPAPAPPPYSPPKPPTEAAAVFRVVNRNGTGLVEIDGHPDGAHVRMLAGTPFRVVDCQANTVLQVDPYQGGPRVWVLNPNGHRVVWSGKERGKLVLKSEQANFALRASLAVRSVPHRAAKPHGGKGQ